MQSNCETGVGGGAQNATLWPRRGTRRTCTPPPRIAMPETCLWHDAVHPLPTASIPTEYRRDTAPSSRPIDPLMTRAPHQVIVDQPRRLHERIDDGRPAKAEAPALEIF